MKITCTNCGDPYPETGTPYLCPNCDGLFDIDGKFLYDPGLVEKGLPGIFRYRQTFPLSTVDEMISLGEGDTPLIWAEVAGRKVGFKCEYQNPTGSFKDRGSAVLTAWLRSRGILETVEDSSGNAGSSFAAYATRAGIKAKIYVPETSSGPKRKQIEAYGAEVVTVSGSRNAVTEKVRLEAEKGFTYASHAYLPYNLPGYGTIAFEIYEQLGAFPGAVIMPAGQGGLLLGMARGFQAIRNFYNLKKIPKIVGVQAKACAPLLEMLMKIHGGNALISETYTLAEGVNVLHPLRAKTIVETVTASNGMMYGTKEDEILDGRDKLARLGLYVEPTSAIVWSALIHLMDKLPDPIVVILTGSGLKSG